MTQNIVVLETLCFGAVYCLIFKTHFFYLLVDPKIEIVDAVGVSFFNGSGLYLAPCWKLWGRIFGRVSCPGCVWAAGLIVGG